MNILLLIAGIILAMPANATEHWEFANYGANAGGKMAYGKNKIVLNTQNTRHCFFESDSYSFAYQKQPFPYDDCSRSTIAVKLDRFTPGSAGIMMRSGSGLGAANVHLEASATGDVYLFYRKADDMPTSYNLVGNLSFPIELKLMRQGTTFTGYYKSNTGKWVKGAVAMAAIGSDPLIGFYACSGSSETQIGMPPKANPDAKVTFSNWTINYEEDFIPAEVNFIDKMPVKPGTLLRDNFDDGSLSNSPATNINPIWNGITFGNLPKDQQGGRYWRKTGDGVFFLGDKKWTDYQVSIDLTFDAANKLANEFTMQLRYQDISIYSKMLRYYAVGLRAGNKLFLDKYEPGGVTLTKVVTIPAYADGKKHTLKVVLLDQHYEIYYGDKKLIEGSDTTRAITYGNVALKFNNTAVCVNNLEILQIDDPVNGSADNYLMDYFDTPIPAYLKKYGIATK